MYKHLLFDLDGTILRSEAGLLDSAEYAFRKLGRNVPPRAELMTFIGPPLYVTFRETYGMSDEDTERGVIFFQEYYESGGYRNAELYPGIPELLAEIRENKDMRACVVTSKPLASAKSVKYRFGLDALVEEVICPPREMTSTSKASLVKQALEYYDIDDLSEAVMIGDREYDIEGAAANGIASIGVLYGYGSREELEKAGASVLAEDVPALRKRLRI